MSNGPASDCPNADLAEPVYAELVAHDKRCQACTDNTPCGVAQRLVDRLDQLADDCEAHGCTLWVPMAIEGT